MLQFLEKVASLDNIHQWEERDSIIKESVSQHSFKVACIAAYLLDRMQCKDMLFRADVMTYAVLHDFDESIIKRDIAHPVKYNALNGDELRRVLNEYVDSMLDKYEWKFVKDFGSDVKMFVKLCDWIALYTFIKRNAVLGSKMFEYERKYCLDSIVEKMDDLDKQSLQCLFNNYEYLNGLREIIITKQDIDYGR